MSGNYQQQYQQQQPLIAMSQEQKERLDTYWSKIGSKRSAAVKSKISSSLNGKKKTEEHKRNIASSHLKDLNNRTCSICGSRTTEMYMSKQSGERPHWFKAKNTLMDRFICSTCFAKQ
jgi:hypothetical protein